MMFSFINVLGIMDYRTNIKILIVCFTHDLHIDDVLNFSQDVFNFTNNVFII